MTASTAIKKKWLFLSLPFFLFQALDPIGPAKHFIQQEVMFQLFFSPSNCIRASSSLPLKNVSSKFKKFKKIHFSV